MSETFKKIAKTSIYFLLITLAIAGMCATSYFFVDAIGTAVGLSSYLTYFTGGAVAGVMFLGYALGLYSFALRLVWGASQSGQEEQKRPLKKSQKLILGLILFCAFVALIVMGLAAYVGFNVVWTSMQGLMNPLLFQILAISSSTAFAIALGLDLFTLIPNAKKYLLRFSDKNKDEQSVKRRFFEVLKKKIKSPGVILSVGACFAFVIFKLTAFLDIFKMPFLGETFLTAAGAFMPYAYPILALAFIAITVYMAFTTGSAIINAAKQEAKSSQSIVTHTWSQKLQYIGKKIVTWLLPQFFEIKDNRDLTSAQKIRGYFGLGLGVTMSLIMAFGAAFAIWSVVPALIAFPPAGAALIALQVGLGLLASTIGICRYQDFMRFTVKGIVNVCIYGWKAKPAEKLELKSEPAEKPELKSEPAEKLELKSELKSEPAEKPNPNNGNKAEDLDNKFGRVPSAMNY